MTFSVLWKPIKADLAASLEKVLHAEPTKKFSTEQITSDLPSECEMRVLKKKRKPTVGRWEPSINYDKRVAFNSVKEVFHFPVTSHQTTPHTKAGKRMYKCWKRMGL
jgi:hypothetical protein